MTFPLRLRLTLAFGLSVALVLAGLAVFLYLRLGAELEHGLDLDLRSRAGLIAAAGANHGPVTVDSARSLIDPDEAFGQVLTPSGRILDASAAVQSRPMLPASVLATVKGPTFFTRQVDGVGDPTRLLATPVRSAGGPVIVVVGANLGDRDEALHRLLLLLALGIPAAVLLASVVGWFVAGGALRPVERLRRDAAAASVTGSGGTVAVPPTGDELARLARTLNDLLRRQREALDAEHRFIDEASHDLRTPLAVLKAELDLAVARPRTRDKLAETVAVAARETDHLVRLAEDLLVLARARRGPMAVHRERVDLVQFCRDCAEPFQLGGSQVTVTAERVAVDLDPLRVRQAVRNLLDNAFRHGGGRDVHLAGGRTPGGQLAITVSDSGPGLPEHFGGRLAGAESASGGLGLAIVTAIAEAHGGWLEADHCPHGARISLIVPEPV